MEEAYFLTEEEELNLFNDMGIFDKQEILRRITTFKNKLKEGKYFESRPTHFSTCMCSLVERFEEVVEKKELMILTEPFWGYQIVISETGISLELCKYDIEYEDVGTDEDPKFDPYPYPLTVYSLFKIYAKMLSPEEYSRIYDVAPGTVRQWIRRGKIRSAQKIGRNWYISELCSINTKGYVFGAYNWDTILEELPEEFAYLNKYNHAEFWGINKEVGTYKVILINDMDKENVLIDEMKLTVKEREQLEVFLIGHPQIFAEDNFELITIM